MIQMDSTVDDPQVLRRAFACFPAGVVAVAALEGGEPVGMTMVSLVPVSLAPPLVSVCAQNTSRTWPRLSSHARLGVSLLAAGHEKTCRQLSSKDADRFAGVDWDATADGAVLVHGASAWLDCRMHTQIPAGDHLLVLLEVLRLRAVPNQEPLVFHGSRFRGLADESTAA